jgi:hypothetical protein
MKKAVPGRPKTEKVISRAVTISPVDAAALQNQSHSLYLERDREEEREGVEEEYSIDPNEQGLIEYELLRLENCGKQKWAVTDREGNAKIITLYCEKPYCPRCGSKNGLLHRRKVDNILAKFDNLGHYFIRHFVFTLPENLTARFQSKTMLNKFIEIVKRIIEREYGILVKEKKTKNGFKKKYRLDQKVLASLELSGERGRFHPHVNVLIFEQTNKKKRKDITPEQLSGIKKSYKSALEKMLSEKIGVINVHYSFHFE